MEKYETATGSTLVVACDRKEGQNDGKNNNRIVRDKRNMFVNVQKSETMVKESAKRKKKKKRRGENKKRGVNMGRKGMCQTTMEFLECVSRTAVVTTDGLAFVHQPV